uniref:AlNc14C303G10411 protein n=1 Tax=Albugo laibachii Nc14 TaxID=890382 RepID=F0WVS4_9STRA|nr:AlNc14C303G10411 [Albugo laibachii Nc14]|eukprot:CCA25520.1 AlNc14C303G10411 [Albugo laibachii Nc14]
MKNGYILLEQSNCNSPLLSHSAHMESFFKDTLTNLMRKSKRDDDLDRLRCKFGAMERSNAERIPN